MAMDFGAHAALADYVVDATEALSFRSVSETAYFALLSSPRVVAETSWIFIFLFLLQVRAGTGCNLHNNKGFVVDRNQIFFIFSYVGFLISSSVSVGNLLRRAVDY
jgi:hypothetical protein